MVVKAKNTCPKRVKQIISNLKNDTSWIITDEINNKIYLENMNHNLIINVDKKHVSLINDFECYRCLNIYDIVEKYSSKDYKQVCQLCHMAEIEDHDLLLKE